MAPSYRILLDTSSLMYRAFFSIPPSVKDESGQPINALHGYLDMNATLVAARHPDEVIHVFDADWRPAPRVALYTGYKAKRPPDPEGLPEQFVLLREMLDAFGLPHAEAPGWEGEDAIGAICVQFSSGMRVDVVTGDRDLIQLVRDPDVRVLFTVRGVTDVRQLDEAGVRAKYGVPASRYADFAILRGDPSDGLPGVRGVGEKTARELVNAYPDLHALVQDAVSKGLGSPPLRKPLSLRPAIRNAAGYIEAMQQVVPIRTDVEVIITREARDDQRLDELAERHRLTGPVRRLRQALESAQGARKS
jgi:5'-3' exonuclease